MSGRQKKQQLKESRRVRREDSETALRAARFERDEVVAADQSRQAPNNSYSPPVVYEDQEFVCIDCGSEEVWPARQQKWWFEVAKGSIYSRANRCSACRATRRKQTATGRESD